MQFRKTMVNLEKIGAVKSRLYYTKRSKQNSVLFSKFFARFGCVGTDIWLRSRQPKNSGTIPCRRRKLFSPPKRPDQLLDPTSLLFNGYLERLLVVKKGQDVKLTSHCRLVQWLTPPLPHSHAFAVCAGAYTYPKYVPG